MKIKKNSILISYEEWKKIGKIANWFVNYDDDDDDDENRKSNGKGNGKGNGKSNGKSNERSNGRSNGKNYDDDEENIEKPTPEQEEEWKKEFEESFRDYQSVPPIIFFAINPREYSKRVVLDREEFYLLLDCLGISEEDISISLSEEDYFDVEEGCSILLHDCYKLKSKDMIEALEYLFKKYKNEEVNLESSINKFMRIYSMLVSSSKKYCFFCFLKETDKS